ncbi:MAG: hypothetical protein IJ067_06155 [Prevotella sp.]|nr:hypothetical protein [Prevotella sp.]
MGTYLNIGNAGFQRAVLVATILLAGGSAMAQGPTINGSVYGGGNEADVKGNAEVSMSAGYVHNRIFGGGNVGSVGTVATRVTLPSGHPTHDGCVLGKPDTFNDNTGICTVKISGGQVGPTGMSMTGAGVDGVNSPDDFGYVFGACRGVVKDPEEDPDIDFRTYVSETHVTISGSTFITGGVYGGSENGRVRYDTNVDIQGGQIGCGEGKDTAYAEEDFINPAESTVTSGLAECAHWEYGVVNPTTGKKEYLPYDEHPADPAVASTVGSDGHTFYGNVFGGGSGYFPYLKKKANAEDPDEYEWLESAGQVEGSTHVTISGGHILTSVYGGNELTNVDGTCYVTMTGGTLGVPRTLSEIADHPVTCYLFGAGKGDQRLRFNQSTNVGAVDVKISGGIIYGSVFGGGEDGHVLGDVKMTISEADTENPPVIGTWGTSYVDGNVFGAGRGFGGDALTAGVVSGNVTIDIKGGIMLGSIYGGGRLGSVGTYLVPSTHADYGQLIPDGKQQTIDRSNHTVAVNEASGVTHGKITINICGGTIGNSYEYKYYDPETTIDKTANHVPQTDFDYQKHLLYSKGGNVFTGSMGRLYALDGTTPLAHWQDLGKCRTTELNISGGTIKSNVYGGSEMGTVEGNATVSITGGTIGTLIGEGETAYYYGSVFGGGKGSTQNIADIVKAGTVGGNVTVELNKGVIERENKKGGIVRKIFGCNDMNGSPKGSVEVHVYATQTEGKNDISTKLGKEIEKYDVEAVYGGGNLAAYEPTKARGTDEEKENVYAHVIVEGCSETSIRQVYGGGNAASTPSTKVEILESYEIEEVFGGGNGLDPLPDRRENPGANVGYTNYSTYDDERKKWIDNEDAVTKEERLTSSYIYGSGKANVDIKGGTIHRVFGGSNTKGNVRITAVTMLAEESGCDFCVDEAYGGGKSAAMDAEAKLLMACIPGLDAAYGGAEAADVQGGVTLTITNGTFDRVFGGNNISGTIGGPIVVNIEETGCKPIIIGKLYGGGNEAAYSVYGYNDDGSVKESGDNPYPDPVVNIRSFTSIGDVFGGGYGETAVMVASPIVNINVSEGEHSGTVIPEDATTETVRTGNAEAGGNYPVPSHTAGAIGAINNVYGGGDAADVKGDTHVNIGTESGDVYMVISNEEVKKDNSFPTGYYTRSGNTYIAVEEGTEKDDDETYYKKYVIVGADIRGNVYGGGNQAEVTGSTNVIIGKEATP